MTKGASQCNNDDAFHVEYHSCYGHDNLTDTRQDGVSIHRSSPYNIKDQLIVSGRIYITIGIIALVIAIHILFFNILFCAGNIRSNRLSSFEIV
jgi:hypothetical protein